MCSYLQWMPVTITQSWVKQTALKDTWWSTQAIINAIGMTWYQVGIASKELQDIRWRTNVFLWITAVLTGQVGFLMHTLQSARVLSIVESVFPLFTAAVTGMKTSEWRTVANFLCMSYRRRITAILAIAVMESQVSLWGCFYSRFQYNVDPGFWNMISPVYDSPVMTPPRGCHSLANFVNATLISTKLR